MMSSSNEADLHEDSLDLDDDKPSRAHASDEGDNLVRKLSCFLLKAIWFWLFLNNFMTSEPVFFIRIRTVTRTGYSHCTLTLILIQNLTLWEYAAVNSDGATFIPHSVCFRNVCSSM